MESDDGVDPPLEQGDVASLTLHLAAKQAVVLSPGDAARASVALVLRESERETEILLIRRARRAGDPWSGHVGFPGGRASPSDPSPLATALRETEEEVSLALDRHGRLIGQLNDLQAMSRGKPVPLIIRPFVFVWEGETDLRLNGKEVAEAFWAPLRELRSPTAQCTHRAEETPSGPEMLGIRFRDHVIWGLTRLMLSELFARLDDSATTLP